MKKKKNKECIAKSGWLQHFGESSVSEQKRERDKQRKEKDLRFEE